MKKFTNLAQCSLVLHQVVYPDYWYTNESEESEGPTNHHCPWRERSIVLGVVTNNPANYKCKLKIEIAHYVQKSAKGSDNC